MLHCDAETLALAAVGEPLRDEDRAHLGRCGRCQQELEQTRAVVAVGRGLTADDSPVEPPGVVWQRVRSDLHLSDGLHPFLPDDGEAGVVSMADFRRQRTRHRRRLGVVGVAAAAAGLVLGTLGTVSLVGSPADPRQPDQLLASSTLSVVPVAEGGVAQAPGDIDGTAEILVDGNQAYAQVDVTALPEIDGYYEVWLIRTDLSGMISLGALSAGSQGRFTIPAGVDIAEYSIVDVSAEPLDGDPVHSRQSLARGVLET